MTKTKDICEVLTELSQEYFVDEVMKEFFKQLTADFTPAAQSKVKNDSEEMQIDEKSEKNDGNKKMSDRSNEIMLDSLNESLRELKPAVLTNKCLKELLSQTAKHFIEHVDIKVLEKHLKESKNTLVVDKNIVKSMKGKKTFKDSSETTNPKKMKAASSENNGDELETKPESDQATMAEHKPVNSKSSVVKDAVENVAKETKQEDTKREVSEEKVDDSEKKDQSEEAEFKLVDHSEKKYSDGLIEFFTSQMQELLLEQPELFSLISSSRPQSIPSTLKHLDLLWHHTALCEQVLKQKMNSFK